MAGQGTKRCALGCYQVMSESVPRMRSAEDLYVEAYPRVVQVVALVTGSRADAEDVVQDAFIRLIDRWERISGYDDPEAWLRLVAIRLARTHLRRHPSAVLTDSAASPTEHRSDEHRSDEHEDHLDLHRALGRLAFDHRQVLVLHYLIGMNVSDIARALRIRPGTVKSRLSRGRVALGGLIQEEEVLPS